MYSLSETLYAKEDWGHSSNVVGAELAIEAVVRHLCLFHSEPVHDDETLDKLLENTRTYARLYNPSSPIEISMAYDGLEIEV